MSSPNERMASGPDDPVGGGDGRPAVRARSTVVGLSGLDRAVLLICGPVVGLLIGFALPPASRGLARLPLPLRGLFRVIGSWETIWVVLACVGAGLLVGAALASAGGLNSLRVTVSESMIEIARGDARCRLARERILAAFADGKTLVVLDRESRQVAREPCEVPIAEMARAFRAYDYPWLAADPYAALYRPWARGEGDLPVRADHLLALREGSLEKKDRHRAGCLRVELENIGFTVREEGDRQFWRPLTWP
jgi:hypothetical protein